MMTSETYFVALKFNISTEKSNVDQLYQKPKYNLKYKYEVPVCIKYIVHQNKNGVTRWLFDIK